MRNSFFSTAIVAAFAACNLDKATAATALVDDDLFDMYDDSMLAQISEAEMLAEREAWFAELAQLADEQGLEPLELC